MIKTANHCDASFLLKESINNRLTTIDNTKPNISAEVFMLCGISRQEVPKTKIINTIKDCVSTATGIPTEHIIVRTRKREIVEARQLVHYFLRRYTRMSLSQIGVMIGDKDHATVLHSVKTINNLKDTDKERNAFFNMIEAQIVKRIDALGSVFINAKKTDTVGDWEFVKHKYL